MLRPTRFDDLRHADKRAAHPPQSLLEECTFGAQVYVHFAATSTSGFRF